MIRTAILEQPAEQQPFFALPRSEGMVVKVIDFGSAKSFADGQQSPPVMSTGGFVGSVQFASSCSLKKRNSTTSGHLFTGGCHARQLESVEMN